MAQQRSYELYKSQFRMGLLELACLGRMGTGQKQRRAVIQPLAEQLFKEYRVTVSIRCALELWKNLKMRLDDLYRSTRSFTIFQEHQVPEKRPA